VATGVLAIGGWLVINRQLTLGQLVASEVIIVLVLSAMEKLVNSFPTYFDLLSALDKVGYLNDLPIDEQPEVKLADDDELISQEKIKVDCNNLSFTYPNGLKVLDELKISIEAGSRVSLVGASGAGKTTLALIICGILKPDKGLIHFNGVDVNQLSTDQVHLLTSFVSDQNDIIEGTVLENITLGRPDVGLKDVQWALETACLSEEVANLSQGLSTQIISSGQNLSRGQIQRLMIARAIVDKPRLLILDECFTGVDGATRSKVLENLLSKEHPWTMLDISHDPELVLQTEKTYILSKGKIIAIGSPLELLTKNDPEFIKLFPSLIRN
jgi:ATP-binding cassette subfamily B protein